MSDLARLEEKLTRFLAVKRYMGEEPESRLANTLIVLLDERIEAVKEEIKDLRAAAR